MPPANHVYRVACPCLVPRLSASFGGLDCLPVEGAVVARYGSSRPVFALFAGREPVGGSR